MAAYLALAGTAAALQAPWWDEAWFASPARNLALHGHMGTGIVYPEDWLKGLNEHTYWMPPLYLVTLAGWIKLLGFGLVRMRLLSVAWGLVALAACWVVAHRVSGRRRVALFTFALISVGYSFVTMASELRMDVMCLALGTTSMAVYLSWRERHLGRAIGAASLLGAAGIMTHPNGAFSIIGLALFALTYDRDRLRPTHALLALAPFVAAAAGWGAYIAQDPAAFVGQFGGNMSNRSGLHHPLDAMTGEAWRIVRFYAFGPSWADEPFRLFARPLHDWPLIAPLLLVAGGVGAAFVSELRREKGLRVIMFLATIVTAVLVFLDMHKRAYYLIYVTPAYVLLGAALADWALRTRKGAGIAVAALATLIAVSVALDLRALRSTPDRSGYDRAVAAVRRYAHGGTVMGSSELAFALGFESGLVDDHTLGRSSGLRPQVLVFNRRYREHLKGPDEPADDRAFMERCLVEYRQVDTSGTYSVYVPR